MIGSENSVHYSDIGILESIESGGFYKCSMISIVLND